MRTDLIVHVLLREFLALEATQLIEHFLLRTGHLRWDRELGGLCEAGEFACSFGVIGHHLIGEVLHIAGCSSRSSLLDWISNISLDAASLTKSAVFGAMPRVEFTPLLSPTDCANAG